MAPAHFLLAEGLITADILSTQETKEQVGSVIGQAFTLGAPLGGFRLVVILEIVIFPPVGLSIEGSESAFQKS